MPFLRNVVNNLGTSLSNKAADAIAGIERKGDGGNARSTIWLPGAKILKDYNITKNNNLFWITLVPKIVGTPTIEKSTGADIKAILKVPNPTKLEEYKILYNDETYSQSHSHNWEKSVIQEKLDEGAKMMNGQLGNMVSRTAKSIYNSIKGKKTTDSTGSTTDGVTSSIVTNIGQRDQYFAANVLDYYANSGVVPIELKFNLVAFDNPITDIILPLKRLISLTYPQLLNVIDQEKLSKMAVNIMTAGLMGADASDPMALEKSREKYKELNGNVKKMTDKTKASQLNAKSRKIVAHYGNPPVLWDVGLSNDLQFMKNAYCKSINVQYMGPWMGKPDQTSAFTGLFGNINKTMGAGIFGAILNPSSIRETLNQGDPAGKGGYPSYATVSMTFEPALTQTADDILALDDIDGKITVGDSTFLEKTANKHANSVGKFVKNRFGGEVRS